MPSKEKENRTKVSRSTTDSTPVIRTISRPAAVSAILKFKELALARDTFVDNQQRALAAAERENLELRNKNLAASVNIARLINQACRIAADPSLASSLPPPPYAPSDDDQLHM
ncbi:hypothetical protein H0H87_002059 [Tephrocybe sp. NHM501043]|nr:hypothetical protein H0H87_002059 [Tephrocybe sp. NHM501043]